MNDIGSVVDIKIIDITRELNESVIVYEGDPQVMIERFYTVEGNGFAVTKLSMGSHSGTHIDAPSHVVEGGKDVSDLPLSALMGECVVVDREHIEIPVGVKNVIIKSDNDRKARLSEKQARQLIDAGVRLVGTNALSIGNDGVHQILLKEDCVILEVLDLSKVACGNYFLCALPLKIKADGAPLRACLIKGLGE